MNEKPSGVAPRHLTARGRRFEQSITINASPREIWAMLEDFSRWSEWSPLYARSQGVLAIGEKLDMAIALDGMKPLSAKATVVSLRPRRLIEYETSPLGGLFHAIRYLEIHPEGPSRSRLVNGEVLGGPLGFLSPRKMGERVLKGMSGMNLALKAMLEESP